MELVEIALDFILEMVFATKNRRLRFAATAIIAALIIGFIVYLIVA